MGLSGEKETKGQPHCSLQLPEDGKWRGRCSALLPRIQCQYAWQWCKAASVREGSDGTLGSVSFPRGCSNPAIGFLERGQCPMPISV